MEAVLWDVQYFLFLVNILAFLCSCLGILAFICSCLGILASFGFCRSWKPKVQMHAEMRNNEIFLNISYSKCLIQIQSLKWRIIGLPLIFSKLTLLPDIKALRTVLSSSCYMTALYILWWLNLQKDDTWNQLHFSKKVIDPCLQGEKKGTEKKEKMGQESSYMNFLG